MIIKPELLKKIRHYFGLNIYEAKVWLALLSRGVSSAGEIAEISSVPRSRTYDVLESLEKQGFAIEKLGKPVRYLAVNPSTIIEKLKRNASTEMNERVESLDNMKKAHEYSELEILYKQGITPVQFSDLSGAVKGRSNVDAQIREMIDNAERQVILATTINALRQEIRFLKPLIEKLHKKGVNIKIAVNATPEELNIVAEYRHLIRPVHFNARFCIVDDKQTLFTLSDKHDEEVGVWVNSQFFTSALKSLFENSWGNVK